MSDKPIALLPPPVPAAEDKHRRQMLTQVWLPLGVAVVVILALMILVVLAAQPGATNVARWANVSLIYMIAPSMFVALVFIAILGGLIYVLAKLIGRLPAYAHLVQAYMNYISALMRKIMDRAVSPVMAVRGFVEGWRAFKREIGRIGR